MKMRQFILVVAIASATLLRAEIHSQLPARHLEYPKSTSTCTEQSRYRRKAGFADGAVIDNQVTVDGSLCANALYEFVGEGKFAFGDPHFVKLAGPVTAIAGSESCKICSYSGVRLARRQEPVEVVKVNTNLVVFDAQVIDKRTKRAIGDLTKEDFELTDNGVRQQISYVSRDELPLSIMLLLDVSRSVRPVIHEIRDGALNALMRLKPKDQVAIMAFGTTHELVQDFTTNRTLASRQIEDATSTDRLGNATFLASALESTAIQMEKAPTPASRRVIVIITDNIAFSTGREQRDVLGALFDSGTVVYGLVVRAALGKLLDVVAFGQIKGINKYVDETGGEILGANKKEVDAKLGLVIDHLRARYAIGFRPNNTIDDGKFRPVEIKVTATKKRKETPVVLTKRGYYFRSRS